MQKKVDVEKALARKFPEQVVLVASVGTVPKSPDKSGSCRSRAGKPNVMAVGWTCTASSDPWMFLVGIDDEALTYANIRKTREFVVAFPSERQAKETLFVGTHHGHNMDKFAACKLKVQRASKVKAPLIAGAVANFECKLVEITRPGDCPLIVGKVVAAHVNTRKSLKRLMNAGDGFKLRGVR